MGTVSRFPLTISLSRHRLIPKISVHHKPQKPPSIKSSYTYPKLYNSAKTENILWHQRCLVEIWKRIWPNCGFVGICIIINAIFAKNGSWKVDSHPFSYSLTHGLRTPNEAFFHWKPELLGLDRQIEQINSGAFEVFSAKLSAPTLVQWVGPCFPLFNHYFYKKLSLYIHIPNIYFDWDLMP